MSDLQIIKKIEEKIGEPLQQLTLQEFEQLGPESREKIYQSNYDGTDVFTRRIPKKSFVIDKLNNVIVLWIDYSPKNINEELKQLKGLRHLLLDRYRWQIFSLIERWTVLNQTKRWERLSTLDLGASTLNSLTVISILDSLSSLVLCSKQIKNLTPLKHLTKLEQLNLQSNQVSDLTPLKHLTKLEQLNLYRNEVSDLSPLRQLWYIKRLNLGVNQVGDLSPLKRMKILKQLNLRFNEISDLSPLKPLIDLQQLNLYKNKVSDLSPLKQLTNLQQLNLGENSVTDISPLKLLTNLEQLNLAHSSVSDLSPLKQLTNLKQLDLQGNQVRDLSIVAHLPKLESINVNGNPDLKEPPEEIIERGAAAIRNYFQQTKARGTEHLYEAKVLFVGDAAVGKTSLMNKLLNPEYELATDETNISTLGIDIQDMTFPWLQDESREFRAHLWDFGGQEIQYYIHQFFLTNRSLYLLVFNDRVTSPNLDYWFRIISMLGGSSESAKSSVLVIQNEKNTDGQIGSFPREEYQKRFKEHFSEMKFLDVNLADKTDKRLMVIKSEVEKQLSNLKHIGDELPKGWIAVRQQLEELREGKGGEPVNHIPFATFRKICENHEIDTEKSQLVLSGYLHDLGIILHYQEDESLFDRIFLSPNWVANSIYKILSDKQLTEWNARFSKEWIFEKWGETYTPEEKNDFLQLMQKDAFDLCYKIKNKKKFNYLAPRVLCPCPPEMANNWRFEQSLRFQYRYRFMPIGVITRIIVRLSAWILQTKRREDLVWKTGVILEQSGSRAIIQETISADGARMIDIAVDGSEHNRKDFLAVIRAEVEKIHDKYPGLAVQNLIPCCCDECLRSEDPKMFEFEELVKYRDSGITEINCSKWETIVPVSVNRLLENISHPKFKHHSEPRETPNSFPNIEQLKRDIQTIMKSTTPVESSTKSGDKMATTGKSSKESVKRDQVFVSYSHADQQWLERVQKNLKVLKHQGIEVNLWDDTKIKAGDKWREEIDLALSKTKVAVLLVSTDFLASDFIMENELPVLIEAAEEEDGVVILPMFLKPCYSAPSITQFQAINSPDRALSKLSDDEQDEELLKLVNRIVELILPTL